MISYIYNRAHICSFTDSIPQLLYISRFRVALSITSRLLVWIHFDQKSLKRPLNVYICAHTLSAMVWATSIYNIKSHRHFYDKLMRSCDINFISEMTPCLLFLPSFAIHRFVVVVEQFPYAYQLIDHSTTSLLLQIKIKN